MDDCAPPTGRLFLALDPPPTARERLAELGAAAVGRWGGRPVPPGN